MLCCYYKNIVAIIKTFPLEKLILFKIQKLCISDGIL